MAAGSAKPKKASGLPDKLAVRDGLRAALERSLASMVAAARETAAGATHEDSRAESDKDMRGTVEGYIARGQAMRAEAIGEELARFEATPFDDCADVVRSPCLVRLEDDDGGVRVYLVAPFGAGTELVVGGIAVTVVTPLSPVGRALVGRSRGDDVELPTKAGPRSFVVDALR